MTKKKETKKEEKQAPAILTGEQIKADFNKRFGEGSIFTFDDDDSAISVYPIPTGIPSVDFASGIGGLPLGRVVEIYGPESAGKTSLAVMTVAEAQRIMRDIIDAPIYGRKVLYVDAENALDKVHMKNLGCDLSNIMISQPDHAEQALDMVEAACHSRQFGVVVVDSVPALVPKRILEGSNEDATMGVLAKLLSQGISKIIKPANESNTLVIFINQVREKVGAFSSYGCLHADVKVPLVDGRTLTMREIVEKNIEGQVWSYNEQTGEMEPRDIVDWHHNGEVEKKEDYIYFETEGIESKGGKFGFAVTTYHEVMTDSGWKEAKDISIGDKIMSKYKSIINGTLQEFLYGMFIGDSHLSVRSKNTACIKLQDRNNPEYVQWKLDKLSPFIKFKRNGVRFESDYSYELKLMKDKFDKRDPLAMLRNHFSLLSLALWYMDDGTYDSSDYHNRCSISVKRFKNNEQLLEEIVNILTNKGFECYYYSPEGSIRFNTDQSKKLLSAIAKYIPSCMQYKLPEEFRNQYEEFNLSSTVEYKVTYTDILNIRHASDRQFKQKGKYDLTIDGNSNYLVGGKENGIIVHNTPETTPGGRALKFYSSMRLDVRRKEIKKGDVSLGQTTTVKFKKNKLATPFTTAEYDYLWVGGVDRVKNIMQVAIDMEIIKRAGAYYFYGEDKDNVFVDGQGNQLKWMGKDAVEEVLRNSPALFAYTNDIVQGRIPKDAQFVTEDSTQDELLEDMPEGQTLNI